MNNIIEYCRRQPPPTDYIKQKTANNDPTISKKMRYSQYIKTARKTKVTQKYTQPTQEVPFFLFGSGQTYVQSVFSYDENNDIKLTSDENIRDPVTGDLITVDQRPQAYHRHP